MRLDYGGEFGKCNLRIKSIKVTTNLSTVKIMSKFFY